MKPFVNYLMLIAIVGLLSGCLRNSAEVNDAIATDLVPSSTAALATLTAIAPPDLIQETAAPTDDLVVYPTPANLVPTPNQQKQYKMADWTPQLADQVIAVLRAYPDNLGFPERGYHDSGYYGASSYALFAEQEALLRFSNSSFEENWVWDAAYRMALIGSPEVIDTYVELINQALSTESIHVHDLETWFNAHENRVQLRVIVLPPSTGLHDSYLIEISDPDESSGIYLSLVSDGAQSRAYPLPASDQRTSITNSFR